jgi:hypothetical protein
MVKAEPRVTLFETSKMPMLAGDHQGQHLD